MLGNGVHMAADSSLQSANRGGVDDAATATIPHCWRCIFGAIKNAGQQDVHGAGPTVGSG